MLCAMLSLSAVLSTPSLYAQRATIQAGNGIKSVRDSVLTFMLDTLKVDSIARQRITDSLNTIPRTAGGASGRTYVRGEALDSTGALYTVGFAQDWTAQVNFSNSASDSTQFVFAGSTGLMLPVTTGRKVMFEYANIKTNHAGTNYPFLQLTFPANVTASVDSSMFAVHIVATGTSPRKTYLRIFKMKPGNVPGLGPVMNYGGLVEVASVDMDPLDTGYFPSSGTSYQIRITLRARWTR
jgi:hypothetical protein